MLPALLVTVAAAFVTAKKEFEPGKLSTIKTDDVHYAIRVPKKLDKKNGTNTIVFIHGSNMRGENYAGSLETASELKDWILIGPTGPHQAGENAYNHDPGDEKYIGEIVEDVEERLKVKIGRLYVGGHSQGGFLSHAVAAHLPERVDGVLAVSSGSWATPKKLMKKGKGRTKSPIPVAIVHAQNDPIVGFGASVAVYDGYVKAKHPAARLFGPADGLHMFMRLPILEAIAWLDLMNSDDKGEVSKVLSKTKASKDPRTAWDAAHRLKELSKGKSTKADGVIKSLKVEAKKRAKDLEKRLKKAKKKGADPELIAEAWLFLGDYGMLEPTGGWRDALEAALEP